MGDLYSIFRADHEMKSEKMISPVDFPLIHHQLKMIGRLHSSISKFTSLPRTSTPQTELPLLMKEQNFEEFRRVLINGINSGSVAIDTLGDLLHIACRKMYHHYFVTLLIHFGADINAVNEKWYYRKAIHFAVESGHLNALQVLLTHPNCDVNSLMLDGDSPLHCAIYNNDLASMTALLDHTAVDVNITNRRDLTPLHVALGLAYMKPIFKLLEHPDIDLDARRDFQNRTCREIITTKYPELVWKISRINPPAVLNDTLFSLLHKRHIHEFQARVKANKPDSRDHDGKSTYLQHACNQGMVEVVEILLKAGVDPNQYSPNNPETPMMIAAYRANYTILKMLSDNATISFEPVNRDTVLHFLFYGMHDIKKLMVKDNPQRDFFKCLEYLLRMEFRSKLDLNYPNKSGDTVLHYATRFNHEKSIKALLHAGAYVGRMNHAGKVPLKYIRASIMEECLDNCISTNGKHFRDDDYEIIFDYSIFTRPKVKEFASEIKDLTEMEALLIMNEVPELRKFLKHPVIQSYLNLKWKAVAKYFYINLIFYVTFCSSLTTYIWCVNDRIMVSNFSSGTVVENTSGRHDREIVTFLWYLNFFLCGVLFIRELYQFYVSPSKYLKHAENWLEMALISSTMILLMCPMNYEQRQQLSSILIMMSWMELMFLIGRHPVSSTNIEMFKTVSKNFLKFLAWYSILIVAFALSFFILFKDNTQDGNKFFKDPALAIIKSVIMLTGEFDAGSFPLFPFDPKSSASYALFVLFIFLVAIVLFNLLNGLAVSDTQAIRSDAKLWGIVSRIKMIAYVDAVATKIPFGFLNFLHTIARYGTFVPYQQARRMTYHRIRIFYENANLFPYLFLDNKVSVLTNDHNTVFLKKFGSWPKKANFDKEPHIIKYFCQINPNIMKEAAKILERKNQQKRKDDKKGIGKKFEEYNSRMENVEKLLVEYNSRLESVDKSIKQIMDFMKLK